MRKSLVALVCVSLFSAVSVSCPAQAEKHEVTAYAVADFTRASPGEFVKGTNAGVHITQGSSAAVGGAAEYRFALLKNNSVGLLYARTPTDSRLLLPGDPPLIWPIMRNEFDLLFTHRFKPELRGRVAPYVAGGGGAILLNGYVASGLDRQGAYVAGGGADFRIAYRVRLRVGLTTDILKASTYSDVTYRSSWTTLTEPKIGFILPLGGGEK